jgi:hypothetical protein
MKVNFFPVAHGNYWKYDYYYKRLSQVTHSLFIGQMKWEMVFEGENVYIREEQNGLSYFAEGDFSWEDETYTDTTYIENRVEIFQVDCLDKVTFYRDLWSRYTTTWMNNRINRLQSPTIGDTIHIDVKPKNDLHYKADYVKNIGLVSFDWCGGTYHAFVNEKANLIEYHINK